MCSFLELLAPFFFIVLTTVQPLVLLSNRNPSIVVTDGYNRTGHGGCPSDEPCFLSSRQDLKVIVGDDATFECYIGNLGNHFVAWLKGDELLTIGSITYTSNKRISFIDDGAKLVVKSVLTTDADTYSCQINTDPFIKLSNSLEIHVPPTAGIIPASELITVVEGEELLLSCETGGNPVPQVRWVKEGGLLPSGDSVAFDVDLTFPSLQREDSGVYVCTATNGVRNPAIARTEVQVNFAPAVTVDAETMDAREGGVISLSCSVESDPQPIIIWTKIGQPDNPIVNSGTYQILETNVGHMTESVLRVSNVREDDFGVWKCQAQNYLGLDHALVSLSGLPQQVIITSGPNCILDTECMLSFKVSSLNSILEYHIRIRQYDNQLDDYGNMTVISVKPDAAINSVDYEEQFYIKDLNHSTSYEVDVYAHTKYGAGPASLPHYIKTTKYLENNSISSHQWYKFFPPFLILFIIFFY